MINGRVGSAFQDAGVQMASYAGDEEGITILSDGNEGFVDESYDGEFIEQGDPTYIQNDSGSGTRNFPNDSSGEMGAGDSFTSPLEDQNPPELLPQNSDNPIRGNDTFQDPNNFDPGMMDSDTNPSNSSSAPQRLEDALDTINELDNIQPPSGGEAPDPLDLRL